MSFENIYRKSKIILAEGALVERLKTEFNLEMDVSLNHAKLIYETVGTRLQNERKSNP